MVKASTGVGGAERRSTSEAGRLPRLLVVGCGNVLAGDDGAGMEVVERLGEAGVHDCQLCMMPSGGVDLLEMFPAAEVVLFVDAVTSGAPAGTLHLVPLDKRESHSRGDGAVAGGGGNCAGSGGEEDIAATEVVPRAVGSLSSHGLSLLEAFELARALGRRVPRVMLLGVEIGELTMGAARSPAVERALTRTVQNFPRLQALLADTASSLWRAARQFPPEDDSFPIH